MVEIEYLEKQTIDGPAGPEGVSGIGGDELNVSPERAEPMLRHLVKRPSVEEDSTGSGPVNLEDGVGQRCLSASGFPCDSHGLSFPDLETDLVHGADQFRRVRAVPIASPHEVGAQVFNLEQRHGCAPDVQSSEVQAAEPWT